MAKGLMPSFITSVLVCNFTQIQEHSTNRDDMIGGSCVVAIFKRPDFFKLGGEDGISRSGYNAADTYRAITQKELDSVKSAKAYSKWADAKM